MGRIIRSIRHRLEDRRRRRVADLDEPVQPRRDASPTDHAASAVVQQPVSKVDGGFGAF